MVLGISPQNSHLNLSITITDYNSLNFGFVSAPNFVQMLLCKNKMLHMYRWKAIWSEYWNPFSVGHQKII